MPITPQISNTLANLNGVAFPDTQHGWAEGAIAKEDDSRVGIVVATADGGTHWTQVLETTMQLRDIAFPDILHGWVVGGNPPTILATVDGGRTWKPQTSGIEDDHGALFAATAFPDAQHGWIVGAVSNGGVILATSDGGATWRHQAQDAPNFSDDFRGVAFPDILHGWVVGAASPEGGSLILATSDGGETWERQTIPVTNDDMGITDLLWGIAFADINHGLAVGDNGTILATADGGRTWTSKPSGTDARLFRVAFPDVDNGWAVGQANDGTGVILVTSDGGDTWTLDIAESSSEPLWGVAFPDIRHGWLVGISGTILRSLEVPLGSVRLTPANASPGESVLVEVLRDDGQPVDPADPVMINGVRGTRRYLQYPEPGTYNVTALVKVGGVVQRASAQVVVTAVAWPDIQPAAGAAPIAVPAAVRRLPLLSAAATQDPQAPYYVGIAAADTSEFQANLARTFKKDPVAAGQLAGALSITAYHWTFGDGATASTANSLVDHDFTAALSVDEEHKLFEVSCAIETAGAGRFEVKRTLSVVNAYAYCRNRGVVAPPVVEESHARKVFSTFEATIAVQNPEAAALSLTSQRISYEIGDAEVMGAVQPLAAPFVLAPNAVTTLNFSIPFTQVPADAIEIQVVLLGKDAAGRAIHVETHLDVALPDHRSSGLILNGFAFTRLATVGFNKVLTVAESTNPTGEVPVWKQGLNVLLVAEPRVNQHVAVPGGEPAPAHLEPQGALPGSGLQLGHTIVSPESAIPVRDTFVPAVSTSFAAQDFSKTFLELNDKPGIQDILFQDADPAQALQGKLLLDDSVGISLRALLDAAKQLQTLVAAPKVGDPCDPDNLGDSIPDGFTCQISQKNGQDEMITWHRHACYANARKGDLVLAPGGPAGFIGGLLRQVSPPQHYGHAGIMTRNYDMITHTTFSEERLLAHPNGSIHIPGLVDEPAPTDGHDPDVLKYGWPGTVTQWIRSAVGPDGNLADLANMPAPGDPEKEIPAVEPPVGDQPPGTYKIAPFNRYAEASYNGGDWEIVPPLVVKPDPFEETPEIRARLHAIADAALADTGKSHYRFFCYTDASIVISQVAPPEAPEWARGTYPSVCSAFIWGLLNRAGVHIESPNKIAVSSDLEAKDIAAGAEVGDESLDGLYLYRSDERRVAAQWLHDKLADTVSQTVKARVKEASSNAGIDLTDELAGLAGDLIKLFSDIGDDVANQMCNTFVSDDSSTAAKDSDAWKQAADSRAVSPDNTLFWDPPTAGGLYGYVVPAAFMPERTEQAPRYLWKFVPTHGALQGILKVNGEPKSRGLVQITDSLTAFTDNNGRYSLPKVPFGIYTAKAQWDQGDGILIPGSQRFEMKAVQQELDFDLQRPADLYRTVHVTGDTFFMKFYTIGSNPRQSFPYEFSVDLAPEPGRETARWIVRQDFHNIYGVAAFLFILGADGTITWNVAWAVSQDANVIEDMADSLSSAVQTISLGFISNLFGGEVNGSDSRSGELGRDAQPPAHDSIRIGPDDGTNGLLNFTIENQSL